MCLTNAIPLETHEGARKCYKVLISDGKGCFVSPFQHDEYRCGQVKYADGYPDITVEKNDFLLGKSLYGLQDVYFEYTPKEKITVGGGFLHTCETIEEALKFLLESPSAVSFREFPYWIIVECEIPEGCMGFVGAWDCYAIFGYASTALMVKAPLTLEEVMSKANGCGFSDDVMELIESKYDKTAYDVKALQIMYMMPKERLGK